MNSRVWLLLALAGGVFIAANLAPGNFAVSTSNDKLDHALAFGALTVVAIWALPQVPLTIILMALLAFNAAIELCQSFFNVGRQSDLLDWIAGAVVTVLLLALARIARSVFPRKG